MNNFISKLNGNEYECGITSIIFANDSNYDEFQLGFRTDGQQKDNLISSNKGSWKENWYVIAKDTMMGDPYFIDTNDNKVYYVGHDCDYELNVEKVVDNLDSFIQICETINDNLNGITEDNTALEKRTKLVTETLNKINSIDSSINTEFFTDLFNIWLDIE